MRVPLSWLSEFAELPKNATAHDVMAQLVKVGLEEEAAHGGEITGPLVVGEVLEFVSEPQANGKTIRWCQVRTAPGDAGVRGIVCGAHNFEVGDKVVVSLPGAELPGGFKISARKTYGHISDGMIASARELGLSEDHSGILRLSELGLNPEVGTDAIELLGLGDSAAEVNVTPDRGYCLSIRGIAREYSHASGAAFTDPATKVRPLEANGYTAKLEDATPIHGVQGCSQFITLEVTDINPIAPTPGWMSNRLRLAGMRSISIAVDITNYVMLELGQPLHAYDADKLSGDITVRRAKPNEKLLTLDGKERALHVEDLLITDESGPIGIAGVMGGASTEVSETTRRVMLEAASFDPISIARSARRHKLPSEASKRFERGVDSAVAAIAVARAAQLLIDLAGGKITGKGGYAGAVEQPAEIVLPVVFASQHVGVDYSENQISEKLEQIGCKVTKNGALLKVVPPTWRPDLTHKTDLVEEVARLVGYDLIPSRIPVAPPGRGLTHKQQIRRRILSALTGSGFVEVLNYPFLSNAQNSIFDDSAAVVLENPLQAEFPQLRKSLLPGLIAAAARNISRGNLDLALVEEGSVFLAGSEIPVMELPVGNLRPSEDLLTALKASLPKQPRMISGLLLGNWLSGELGLPELEVSYQNALAAVAAVVRAAGLEFEIKQQSVMGLHPGRSGLIVVADKIVGMAGELHPEIALEANLNSRTAVFELNLDLLSELAPKVLSASELRVMPAATQDLSLVVAGSVTAADLKACLVEGAGELLESISLIDIYRGEKLGEGSKSMTFSLVFRAADRTLTQAEVNLAKDAAVELAAKKHEAKIRT